MQENGFHVGLGSPAHAVHFDRCCISINRLRGRKKPVECAEVMVDSGAFVELEKFGKYRHSVKEYAAELHRLYRSGAVKIIVAVAQDYMCEPFMLAKTGMTVEQHQRLTIERYDALVSELDRLFGGESPFPVMPVLQGYEPAEYYRHVKMYGERLRPGMWVGVGSVCKRNGSPERILDVLSAIHEARSDLRLHGFGIKRTSLAHAGVRSLLGTADSMAWSFAARKQGRNRHCWKEAMNFAEAVRRLIERPADTWQPSIFAVEMWE